jgi:iron-sulfur cluster insertion protein
MLQALLDICPPSSEIHMMTTPFLTITPAAAERILKITSGPTPSALRLAVNGGGCSGFQYEFKIDANREAEDLAFEKDGATVLVDNVSMLYVDGSVLDFEDNLMGEAFKVKNPQAKSSCGCGVSFSF